MKRIVLTLILITFIAGCRTAAIQQYNSIPVAYSDRVTLSMPEISNAIAKGGKEAGWSMKRIDSSHFEATYVLKTHQAVVDVFYSLAKYDIRYKDSTNLKYDGQKIHRAYNKWVEGLRESINKQLASAHYK